ncbi:unnamed protein product [Spirodela intermedia]|uniref:Uncharacterized protein n=1 Tax=Spirodela intermedia TaxID=51605 RepID=A0A7I8JQ65_SPIIN|nr:unnamed protein product [Spirodela intermedia]CAA6671703.1 unnamed protein product [Spirodela intermedia]
MKGVCLIRRLSLLHTYSPSCYFHPYEVETLNSSVTTSLIMGLSCSPALAEDVSVNESNSGRDATGDALITGLRRIEDGSGKVDEAEKYFLLASKEAKEGFGERDPHVASSLNNLAELYRVQKEFHKAEPLYLEALNILQEAFGPEDVRVGAALHNLGQFYLVRKNLDEAQRCYERALKIKGRVLGYGHTDYADTMYHLGTVLYLQGKEKDGEVLIRDSIRILEVFHLKLKSVSNFVRRMRYLSQMLVKSGLLREAEALQRKILHVLEISKGWSPDTVIAAEQLALTLQSLGDLLEARSFWNGADFFFSSRLYVTKYSSRRCLHTRKNILHEEHIQVAANMLHLARVKMLCSSQLRKSNLPEARAALDKAKLFLEDSIRIAKAALDPSKADGNNRLNIRSTVDSEKDYHMALIILLQSLNAVGLLEVSKYEVQEQTMQPMAHAATESEHALCECISIYREPAIRSLLKYPDVEGEYLSCLRSLMSVLEDYSGDRKGPQKATLQELKYEVKRIEDDIAAARKNRS